MQNASLGERPVWYSGEVLLEQEDAKALKEGLVVTLLNWGNVKVERVHLNADGSVAAAEGVVQPPSGQKDFKGTVKLTWLAQVPDEPLVRVAAFTYDNVISKAVLAPEDDFKQFINRDSKVPSPESLLYFYFGVNPLRINNTYIQYIIFE